MGVTYGFRYRVKNIYGWSDFSPVTNILAADLPNTPEKPEFVSATDNSISIIMFAATDDNGAFVTSYVLEMDFGDEDTDFSEVTSYDQTSFLMSHTVTFAADGITTGAIYSFRFKAINSKGHSEYSEFLSVAAISPPNQPSTPVVDYAYSSRTSIYVSWDLNEDGLGEGGLITGYKLYMDDGAGGDFVTVMDTVGYTSQIREHLA
jgi:hypothetical protein